MHDAVRYLKEVMHDKDKLCEYEDILCETLRMLETQHPELVKRMLIKMHVLAFGNHFDDVLAEEAVEHMVNVDGTTGGHWTRAESDELAEKMEVQDKALFFYLINMFCSDYHSVLGNNNELYARMAKSAINDPDGDPFRWVMMYLWSK